MFLNQTTVTLCDWESSLLALIHFSVLKMLWIWAFVSSILFRTCKRFMIFIYLYASSCDHWLQTCYFVLFLRTFPIRANILLHRINILLNTFLNILPHSGNNFLYFGIAPLDFPTELFSSEVEVMEKLMETVLAASFGLLFFELFQSLLKFREFSPHTGDPFVKAIEMRTDLGTALNGLSKLRLHIDNCWDFGLVEFQGQHPGRKFF